MKVNFEFKHFKINKYKTSKKHIFPSLRFMYIEKQIEQKEKKKQTLYPKYINGL